MCGILASFGGDQPQPQVFRAALDRLSHRGPDGAHVFQSRCERIMLGHRLLRIVDRHGGEQPVHNEQQNIFAVVNGELYDEQVIRANLERRGHRFATQSDSEILIHLYEEYGTECLEYLNGEFAFVLWDEKKQLLFAARDRFGIKPLYYTQKEGQLFLASESKAFFGLGVSPDWDSETLLHIFTHQYPLPHQSLFAGISLLPPGHFLCMSFGGSPRISSYWDISYEASHVEIEDFLPMLRRAIQRRLRSDCRRAVYLSGGIDSATILALSSECTSTPLNSYTVRFAVDAYDESQEASKIADHFGSRHHIVDVGQEDIITHLEDAVWYGESFGINGQLPAKFILSKRVQQDGVRVVLSGEGADEALLGYPHLKQDWLYSCTEEERLNVQKLLDTEHALTKGVFLPTSTHEHATHPTFLQSKLEFGAVLHSWMTKEGKEQLVQHDPVGALFRYFSLPKHRVYQGAHLWTKLALAGYILRGIGDGMEMAHSIEGRPPFLDHELFSFCSSLPMKHKLHNGIDKRILRSSMKGILPSWVCTKPKHPFLAPPISIFSSPRGSELMHDMLRSKHIYDIPHIDPQRVHTFLDELKKNQDQTSRVRLEAPIMLLLSAVLMQKRISEHR